MIKKIALFGIVAAVAVGIYGYREWNRKVESMTTRTPDVKIAAVEFATAYTDDVHLGKIVEVSGKLSNSTTENGKINLTLDTGNPLVAVVCEMDSTVAVGNIAEGSDLVLRGQCDGKLSDIQLSRCVFIK